jgi:hypothetical protein
MTARDSNISPMPLSTLTCRRPIHRRYLGRSSACGPRCFRH